MKQYYKYEIIGRSYYNVMKAYLDTRRGTEEPSWEEFPKVKKDLLLQSIESYMTLDITAESLHDEWVEKLKEEGWVYGNVENSKLKTHPDIVPYDELPEETRMADSILRAIVDSFKPKDDDPLTIVFKDPDFEPTDDTGMNHKIIYPITIDMEDPCEVNTMEIVKSNLTYLEKMVVLMDIYGFTYEQAHDITSNNMYDDVVETAKRMKDKWKIDADTNQSPKDSEECDGTVERVLIDVELKR